MLACLLIGYGWSFCFWLPVYSLWGQFWTDSREGCVEPGSPLPLRPRQSVSALVWVKGFARQGKRRPRVPAERAWERERERESEQPKPTNGCQPIGVPVFLYRSERDNDDVDDEGKDGRWVKSRGGRLKGPSALSLSLSLSLTLPLTHYLTLSRFRPRATLASLGWLVRLSSRNPKISTHSHTSHKIEPNNTPALPSNQKRQSNFH